MDDFIAVAPSFPEGFQLLEAKTDKQLADLFAALQKKYRLHDKLFISRLQNLPSNSHYSIIRSSSLSSNMS